MCFPSGPSKKHDCRIVEKNEIDPVTKRAKWSKPVYTPKSGIGMAAPCTDNFMKIFDYVTSQKIIYLLGLECVCPSNRARL